MIVGAASDGALWPETARAGLDAEHVEEEMSVRPAGGRMLRRRDLPQEDRGRCLKPRDGVRGGEVHALLGGVWLPLKARRGRSFGTAYTVGAKLSALFGSDALKFVVADLMLNSKERLRGARSVRRDMTGMFFRAGHALAVAISVPAVSGGDVRRGGHRVAPHVGAGRGSEHAAPAAQQQG